MTFTGGQQHRADVHAHSVHERLDYWNDAHAVVPTGPRRNEWPWIERRGSCWPSSSATRIPASPCVVQPFSSSDRSVVLRAACHLVTEWLQRPFSRKLHCAGDNAGGKLHHFRYRGRVRRPQLPSTCNSPCNKQHGYNNGEVRPFQGRTSPLFLGHAQAVKTPQLADASFAASRRRGSRFARPAGLFGAILQFVL